MARPEGNVWDVASAKDARLDERGGVSFPPSRASTPTWLYFPAALASNDIMEREPGVWVEGPDGELIPDYDSTFPEINEGQVVHGTVVRVDKDEVLVDIGTSRRASSPSPSSRSAARSTRPTRCRWATRSTRWCSRRRTPKGA